MNRFARKVDGNHAEIVRALEQIGVGVLDTSTAGDGWSDLVTFYRGVMRAVEIKDGDKAPSARKLTIPQVRAHELARVHGCTIYVVTSVDEALRLHGARV
jgi:hypothetical protein